MKTCKTCPKLVKNNFNFCYECKDKQDNQCQGFVDEDNESSPSTEPTDHKYHKEPIPKTLKNCLWINYFKDSRSGLCLCCKREVITFANFHAGHICAESMGGKTSLENLIPLCQLCNTSMGKQNVYEFIARYNLHHGL